MSQKQVSRQQVIRAEANAIPDVPEDQELTSWRGDPEANFSDWKIEVVSTQGTQTYHVHRRVLGCGPRRSEYFKAMFQQNCSERTLCTSRLPLVPIAASAFPKLLDFTYQCTKELDIDTESATALFGLGEYLRMEQVSTIAMRFIRNDMTVSNMGMYWEHVQSFPEDTLHDIMANFLVRNKLKFKPSDDFIEKTALPVWEKVATIVRKEENRDEKDALSERLTNLFAKFLTTQTEPLEAATFQSILSEDSAPSVHPEAALILAEQSVKILVEESVSPESSLMKRCSMALAESSWFHDGMSAGDKEIHERLAKLPGSFVAMVWKQSIERSSMDDPTLARKSRDLKTKLQAFDYPTVLNNALEMYKNRREELNGVVAQLRAAGHSLQEAMACPQYQCVEDLFNMQTEVFDEVIAAKFMEMLREVESFPPIPKRAKTDKAASAKSAGEGLKDAYPVGKKYFHRDPTDGFGGLEYPARIIPSLQAGVQPEHRRIAYEGYGSKHDKDVHISELLDCTKEREEIYDNETIPILKRNAEFEQETRQNENADGTSGEDIVQHYELNKVYYLRERDGTEYPVTLVSICANRKRGKVKYVHYKTEKRVDLFILLQATPEREDEYSRRREMTEKQKQLVKMKKEKTAQPKPTNNKRKVGTVVSTQGRMSKCVSISSSLESHDKSTSKLKSKPPPNQNKNGPDAYDNITGNATATLGRKRPSSVGKAEIRYQGGGKIARLKKWENGFDKLQEYKEKVGSCNVQAGDCPKLALWVARQRDHLKEGILTQQRQRRLEVLGLEWDSANVDSHAHGQEIEVRLP